MTLSSASRNVAKLQKKRLRWVCARELCAILISLPFLLALHPRDFTTANVSLVYS